MNAPLVPAAALLGALATIPLAARAQSPAEQPTPLASLLAVSADNGDADRQEAPSEAEEALFPVEAVDRDVVPAGTPEAFEAIYGNTRTGAKWYQSNVELDGVNFTLVPLALIPLSEGHSALISTGQSECDGHACAGINAVHYLERDGRYGEHQMKGEWLDVGAAGTFGNPAARWGWTDTISGVPVLYTEAGGTWQGYHCSWASLTELRPNGPVEIANIPITYSDSGAADTVTSLEGRVTAAEKGRSLTVHYSGTRSFDETYVRDGDQYKLATGESAVPTC